MAPERMDIEEAKEEENEEQIQVNPEGMKDFLIA